MPTWFIRNQECLESLGLIRHFDLEAKQEVSSHVAWLPKPGIKAQIGITAGASCPNNLIEEVILRMLELRGEKIPA